MLQLSADLTRDRTSKLDAEAILEIKHLARDLKSLGEEVRTAVWAHGVVEVSRNDGARERVFAYEVDGYGGTGEILLRSFPSDWLHPGSYTIADDANIPSLLSLPYLGFVPHSDPVYLATRALVLSERNKWYFTGKVASGVGGMHVGTPPCSTRPVDDC